MDEKQPLIPRGQQLLSVAAETTIPIADIEWHEHDAQFVIDHLQSHREAGLSRETARRLLRQNGRNQLTPAKQSSLLTQFLTQLVSGFGALLWCAALLCFLAWKPLGDPPDPLNLTLALCLVGVIVVQALFNLYQEFSSRKVMEALANMIPTAINVIRDGEMVTINPQELVKGDIVDLRAGTLVPADMRLIHVGGMKIDASSLTGESDAITCTVDPCRPGTDIGHAQNMALFGTTVVDGLGQGVVVATGDLTVLGATVSLATHTVSKATPLQLEIQRFVIIIAILSLLTGLVTFLVWQFHLKSAYPNFLRLSDILVNVISLIVAYVPEGMPVAVTVTLRLVAQRMRKQKLLVRSLTSVETLGSVTAIASDKTGTITQNRMTVVCIVYGLEVFNPFAITLESNLLAPVLRAICLCNGAVDNGHGDATDRALLRLYEQFNLDGRSVSDFRKINVELARIPFNSSNKWMLTIQEMPTERGPPVLTVFMKGAFELMLTRSATYLDRNGLSQRITDDVRDQFLASAQNMASHGRRVIAVCSLELDSSMYTREFPFDVNRVNFPMNGLCIMALFGLEDPPRPGVRNAIESCRSAGIRVMMVTGDHPETALAISREISLITTPSVDRINDYQLAFSPVSCNSQETFDFRSAAGEVKALVITGSELERFGESVPEWDWIVSHQQIVFARTTPDQKLRIVQQLQKRGHIVAATGDGVNDAAAIKCADVGLAMGSGTDAAKQAAGMILLDDSFSSIVAGVESGRMVFENLQKVILYLLPAGSWSEMLPVLANVFLGMPQALSSFQMIMICMLTDIFPSLSMVYEPPEADIMSRPPRNIKTDRLVTPRFIMFAYGNIGMLESLVAFCMFFWYMSSYVGFAPGDLIFAYDQWGNDGYLGHSAQEMTDSLKVGQSVFFVTLVIMQFGNALSIRTRRVTGLPPWHPANIYMVAAICCSLCIALFLVNIPAINSSFNTAPVPWEFWCVPFGTAFLLIVWDELRKLGVRRAVPYLRHIWW